MKLDMTWEETGGNATTELGIFVPSETQVTIPNYVFFVNILECCYIRKPVNVCDGLQHNLLCNYNHVGLWIKFYMEISGSL